METELSRLGRIQQVELIKKEFINKSEDKSYKYKLIDFEELSLLRKKLSCSKIVHCHGVFDMLHAGHLAYFESAKKFGDTLVVTVTADPFVNKGPGRPYFNSIIRANMLAALEVVDFVAINHNPTAVPAITELKPDFYVKGPDYRDMQRDLTKGIFFEEAEVQKWGGQLVFTDDITYSSSALINRYFSQWSDEQLKALNAVKEAGGADAIEEALEKISQQKLVIIGEPIIDAYVFCWPESISSKSPSISARYLYEDLYAGGILAIANHAADFVQETTLLTTHGGESYFRELIKNKLDSRIELVDLELANIPTPKKTRFISKDQVQRVFELTHLRSDQWLRYSPAEFGQLMIKKCCFSDQTVILGDFGHGLFEQSILKDLEELKGFIALNVQTNSSNFGFNPFTKHRNYHFLSIDKKELQIAYHDRYTSVSELAERVKRELQSKGVSFAVTLGPDGAYFFSQPSHSKESEAQRHYCPAFSDTIVDATGAGDAFFLMASLLVRAGCSNAIVPFVANVFAGLKTKILGHQTTVSKAQLVKAISCILK